MTIIRGLRRFRELGWRDRRLVIEAAALLCASWAGLRLLSFPRLHRYLTGDAMDDPGHLKGAEGHTDDLARVSWAVTATSRYLPMRATCLVEALAAESMLRRRGVPCELRFGVRAAGDARPGFAAHAWIEHDGSVVMGRLENLADYAVLSPRGRA